MKWHYGKFEEIPSEWESNHIGDMIKFEGGSQPSYSSFVFEPKEGYVRMIQIRDFKTDHHATFIKKSDTRKFFKKNDVMIGRYGPPNFQILRGLEGAYNVALIKTIPQKDLEKEYVYYFLKQKKFFKLMDSLAQRTGGQNGLELDILKKLSFPIPQKKERVKIISILSNMDDIILSYDGIISKTKLLKQSLIQQLFTKGIKNEQFVQTKIGMIPKNWTYESIQDVCNEVTLGVVNSATPYYTEKLKGIPYFRSQNVRENNLTTLNLAYIKPEFNNIHPKSILKENDVLTVQTGVKTGMTCIVPKKHEGCNCHSLLITRPNPKKLLPAYLSQLLNSALGKKIISSLSMQSNREHLLLTDWRILKIPIPSISEQQQIVQLVLGVDLLVSSLKSKKTNLEQLKQESTQKLLTGKIRVKV
jgi:type I restriction enzyme, S subunit